MILRLASQKGGTADNQKGLDLGSPIHSPTTSQTGSFIFPVVLSLLCVCPSGFLFLAITVWEFTV